MSNGFVIGGTNSGCGKTTITLALLAYLKREGFDVSPFKVGPDFIDPGHHKAVTGRTSFNLDGWMMEKQYNRSLFDRKRDAISIVEGVMGLYDGYDGRTENGSTAQMAKWLNLPVILVVNARSMARSAAALVSGYENFDRDLKFAGVIFNNIGSENHLKYLKDALLGNVKMPCLGGIPRDAGVEIPERHLGLVTMDDHFLNQSTVNKLADLIAENIDTSLFKKNAVKEEKAEEAEKNVKIAVARDRAFCFYYQDNIEILEKFGAEIIFFSPLNDEKLPEGIDGIYLGGGYPELNAEELSLNLKMKGEIREKSDSGMPIYAECGGFMYLTQGIETDGKVFEMTGCFDFKAKMLKKRKALGYREITIKKETPFGKAISARGHEFHYSELSGDEDYQDFAYEISKRSGLNVKDEGYLINNTLGSYVHLHFGSNERCAENFVLNCEKYKGSKI